MKVYRFVLINPNQLIMSTEVDECDPRIDQEFWGRFLEGDCQMEFLGEFEEVEDELA